MRPWTLACLVVALGFVNKTSFSQKSKMLLKPWIVTGIYLPDSSNAHDTQYLRYTFEKNKSYTSFSPEWNTMPQDWSVSGDLLTIGVVPYHIDALTDSTLVISSPGFRTMTMEDENYLNRDSANLHLVGMLNGETVYEANRYITPRYKKGNLEEYVREKDAEISIAKESTFIASFIVHKDGTVSDVKLTQGIFVDFDNLVLKALIKTSKDWTPAIFKGKPVNTQVKYTIHFLDSPSARGY